MQDSRIGAFGVLALVAVLMLKVAFVGELADNILAPALLLAPAVGRWAMVLAIHSFPAARAGGMGDLIKQHSGRKELLIATATALTAAGVGLGIIGLAVAALAAGMGLLLGRLSGIPAWRTDRRRLRRHLRTCRAGNPHSSERAAVLGQIRLAHALVLQEVAATRTLGHFARPSLALALHTSFTSASFRLQSIRIVLPSERHSDGGRAT